MTRFVALVVLFLLFVPAAMASDFGVRLGRLRDAKQNFVGAELLFDLGAVNVNPNIEYQLDNDNATAGSVNLDLTVDLARLARATPYAGAGVGMSYVDDDSGNARTDVLGNLIGGVAFDLDFLKPYAQVKYSRNLDDENGTRDHDLALIVGLRF